MTNLEITNNLILSERSLGEKLSNVNRCGMIIWKDGIDTNDMNKIKQGFILSSIPRNEYNLFRLSGRYINVFFLQSMMKDKSIYNDLISETIVELLKMDISELVLCIDESLENIDSINNNSLLSDKNAKMLIVDYGNELEKFKSLINMATPHKLSSENWNNII